VTKRRDVTKTIVATAKKQGLTFGVAREGGNHTVCSLDGLMIPIARHGEIGNRMAAAITSSANRSSEGLVEVTMYHAEASRDGKSWLVFVPEVDRHTQARNLAEVELIARDLVAVMLEVPPDSFELDVSIELPLDVRQHLQRSKQLRDESDRAKHDAAVEVRLAAKGLRDQGLTVRDIGRTLEVSYQRAHQLVNS